MWARSGGGVCAILGGGTSLVEVLGIGVAADEEGLGIRVSTDADVRMNKDDSHAVVVFDPGTSASRRRRAGASAPNSSVAEHLCMAEFRLRSGSSLFTGRSRPAYFLLGLAGVACS